MSLRVRHPAIDPAEISRALGLEPVHAFKAGELRAPRSNLSAPSAHSESYWLATLQTLTAPPSQRSPADSSPSRAEVVFERIRSQMGTLGLALNFFLSGFARRHEEFLRTVQREGGQVTLLVEVAGGACGFAITPEMSRMLEKTGITIEFEFGED